MACLSSLATSSTRRHWPNHWMWREPSISLTQCLPARFDPTGQSQAQQAVVKGIVGLGKMAFLFEFLHDRKRHLGALLIRRRCCA